MQELLEIFLPEGIHDAAFRARAQDAWKKMIDAIELDPHVLYTADGEQLGGPATYILSKDFFPESNFIVAFVFVPENKRPFYGDIRNVARGKVPVISLYIKSSRGLLAAVGERSDIGWFFGNQIREMLDGQNKSAFIHEFTHLLDYGRFKGSPPHSGEQYRAGKIAQHYNNPVETNAYTQELFAAFEDEIEKYSGSMGDEPARWFRRFGKTASDFYTYFMKFAHGHSPSFFKYMDQRTATHLKKRVAQLYTDTLDRYQLA